MTRTKLQAKVAGEYKAPACKLRPPDCLPDEARPLWDEIVSSVGPRHFRRSDVMMLAQFVVLTATSMKLWGDLLKFPDAEALKEYSVTSRTLNSLAGKLRLLPSTRDPRQRDSGNDPAQKESLGDGFFGSE